MGAEVKSQIFDSAFSGSWKMSVPFSSLSSGCLWVLPSLTYVCLHFILFLGRYASAIFISDVRFVSLRYNKAPKEQKCINCCKTVISGQQRKLRYAQVLIFMKAKQRPQPGSHASQPDWNPVQKVNWLQKTYNQEKSQKTQLLRDSVGYLIDIIFT